MPLARLARLLVAVLSSLLLGVALWAAAGYLLTAPLGLIFGWSGHPSVPDAPTWLYVVLYLVALPAGCLALAWRIVRAVRRAASHWLGRSVAAAGSGETEA